MTAKKAEYQSYWNARQKYNELSSKAKSENRSLSSNEKQEILKAGNGELPPVFSGPETWQEPNLKIENIEITGDQAVIRFVYGPLEDEASYVKINNKWYIYKITLLHSDV